MLSVFLELIISMDMCLLLLYLLLLLLLSIYYNLASETVQIEKELWLINTNAQKKEKIIEKI